MSNEPTKPKTDTKPETAAKPEPKPFTMPAAGKAEAMAVKQLRFSGPTDIPGAESQGGLKASAPEPGRRHTSITYLPWMRHHVIVITEPSKDTIVRYVHETKVQTWEPA